MTTKPFKSAFEFFAKKMNITSQEDDPVLFELGRNGTTRDIKQYLDTVPRYEEHDKIISLCNGAMSALRDQNRVEALQAVESHMFFHEMYMIFSTDFKTITEDELNLLYKDMPEEIRQERLDTLLVNCDSTPLVKALINAGADPNVNHQHVLRNAAADSKVNLVTFLHAQGADFDAAILHESQNGQQSTVRRLQSFQKTLTGEMSDYSPSALKRISELQENVGDLTQKYKKLEQQVTNNGQSPTKPGMRSKTKTVNRQDF